MTSDYQVKLDLLDSGTSSPTSAYAGSVTPVEGDIKPEENSGLADQLSASALSTVPARVGISSTMFADKIYRSFSSTDSGYNTDPTFTPEKKFDLWKKSGYGEGSFDTIMRMQNPDDFSYYKAQKDDAADRSRIIAGYGTFGSAANFIANVATDPTMYAGGEIAKALDEGVIAAKCSYNVAADATAADESYSAVLKAEAARADLTLAQKEGGATVKGFAIGAGSSAALSEGVGALTSSPDERPSFGGALFNVAASAAVGGLLGKAVGSYAELKAAKAIEDVPFSENAMKGLWDADGATTRLQNIGQVPYAVGADVNPDLSKGITDNAPGGSALGRFLTTLPGVRQLSPALRGQNFTEPELRNFAQQLYGTSVLTKSNFAGEATGDNVAELTRIRVNQANNDLRGYIERRKALEQQTGHVFDAQSEKRAFLLAHSGEDLSNPDLAKNYSLPEIHTAQFYQDYFGKFRNEIDNSGIPGFTARKVYGTPLLIDSDAVNKNFGEFTDIWEKSLNSAKSNAPQELNKMRAKIAELQSQITPDMPFLDQKMTKKAIDVYEKEAAQHRFLVDATPEEVRSQASLIANAYANKFKNNLGDDFIDEILPRSFRERTMSPKKLVDFAVTDPTKLANVYAHDVSPALAAQKVFKTPDINDEFLRVRQSIAEKAATLRAAGDTKGASNIEQQMSTLNADKEKGWGTITGSITAQQYNTEPGRAITNIANVTSGMLGLSMLGGRVLGSISELGSVMLHNALGGGTGGLAHVAFEMATNPELRNASKDMLGQLGIGLEYFKNNELHQQITDYLRDETVQKGFTQTLGALSRLNQKVTLGVQYDTLARSVMSLVHTQVLKEGMENLISGDLSRDGVASLAKLGIDQSNAPAIIAELNGDASKKIGGILTTDISKWSNKSAASDFTVAVNRDLGRHIIMHNTGDTPFWFHTPAGKVLAKFKSWGVGATQQYLLNTVQRTDPVKTMAGVAGFVGLSALINSVYNAAEGKDQPDSPTAALYLAGARSGMLGVAPELGGNYLMKHIAQVTNPDTNRYYRSDSLSDFIAGPLGQAGGDVGHILGYGLDSALGNDKAPNEAPGAIKSLIDLLPIPLVKPLIRSAVANH